MRLFLIIIFSFIHLSTFAQIDKEEYCDILNPNKNPYDAQDYKYKASTSLVQNYFYYSANIGLKMPKGRHEFEPEISICLNKKHQDNMQHTDYHRAYAYGFVQRFGFSLNYKYFLSDKGINECGGRLFAFSELDITNMGRYNRRQQLIGYDTLGNPILRQTTTRYEEPVLAFAITMGLGIDIKLSSRFGLTTRAGIGPTLSYNKFGLPSPLLQIFTENLSAGVYYNFGIKE